MRDLGAAWIPLSTFAPRPRFRARDEAHSARDHFLTGGRIPLRTLGQRGANEFFDGTPAPGCPSGRTLGRFVSSIFKKSGGRSTTFVVARQLGHHRSWRQQGPTARWRGVQARRRCRSRPCTAAASAPSIFEATYADYTTTSRTRAAVGGDLCPSCRWCGRSADAWPHRRMPSVAGSRPDPGSDGGVTRQVEGGVVGPPGTAAELVASCSTVVGDVRSSGAGASVRLQSAASRLRQRPNAGARLSERGVTIPERLAGSLAGSAPEVPRSRPGLDGLHRRPLRRPERLDPSRPPGGAGDFVEANVRGCTARVSSIGSRSTSSAERLRHHGDGRRQSVYAVPRLPVEGRRVVFGAESPVLTARPSSDAVDAHVHRHSSCRPLVTPRVGGTSA